MCAGLTLTKNHSTTSGQVHIHLVGRGSAMASTRAPHNPFLRESLKPDKMSGYWSLPNLTSNTKLDLVEFKFIVSLASTAKLFSTVICRVVGITGRLLNSLGSTFLDPVVRVFVVRNSRRLRLCLRNQGLISIGLVRGGSFAWLAEGGAIYVLHDPSMIMSKYKRGRGGENVVGTIACSLFSWAF